MSSNASGDKDQVNIAEYEAERFMVSTQTEKTERLVVATPLRIGLWL
jgi:hypothetical protein